jgi:hypothetical protein
MCLLRQVWASSTRRAVVLGGIGGSLLITLAIFLFGFAGWLAAAGGLINFETTNPNLFMFQVFKSSDRVGGVGWLLLSHSMMVS